VIAAEVNRQRCSIKHAEDATPPGFWVLSQRHQVRIRVAPQAITRLKGTVRKIVCVRR